MKTALVFGGKVNEKKWLIAIVVAFPGPTATWDRNVSDDFVIPINDFTFNVNAYVNATGDNCYGTYKVTIDNRCGTNLTLNFIIGSEGNVYKHVLVNNSELSNTIKISV